MTNREPTLGELADDIHEIKSLLQGGTFVRQDVYHAHRDAAEHAAREHEVRLVALDGRLTWAFRTAVVSLALPLLVAAVLFLVFGGGQ